LSNEAWGALLRRLDADPEKAGYEYERLRSRLVRFFEWQRCVAAEDLADIVLTRLANKIEVGEGISNTHAYAMGVARFVLREQSAGPTEVSLDDHAVPSRVAAHSRDAGLEIRAACLDRCLERLPYRSRDLVLRYYEGEGHTKIEQRRAMAASLQISERALRLRVFRVRESLEACVVECLTVRQRMAPTKHSWPSAHQE
jgi:DNA-directed RNA polymerase specialized sigma24 family protein